MGGTSVNRGRRSFPIRLAAGAAAAAAILAATFVLQTSSGGAPAQAHIDPPGCDTTFGSAFASIRIVGAPPQVTEGQVLNYKVGATNNGSGNNGCDIFNVDVYIRLPGETSYVFVCNIADLPFGGPAQECPDVVPYTAELADRTGTLLIANSRNIGNKHDRADDCIVPEPRDGNGPVTQCFDSTVVSVIDMPSPTPTHTPTSTPTSTPTAVNTSTPTRTNTPVTPSRTPEDEETPERRTPTRTSTAAPTRTSVVLPATPRPTSTAVGVVTLPRAGSSGGSGGGLLAYAIAGIAAAAALTAGAGLELQRRSVK
jgi:hypothetical protein